MIDIPGFIKAIEEGNMPLAYEILGRYTNLPAICGAFATGKTMWNGLSIRALEEVWARGIGKLERLVADWALEQPLEYKEINSDENIILGEKELIFFIYCISGKIEISGNLLLKNELAVGKGKNIQISGKNSKIFYGYITKL